MAEDEQWLELFDDEGILEAESHICLKSEINLEDELLTDEELSLVADGGCWDEISDEFVDLSEFEEKAYLMADISFEDIVDFIECDAEECLMASRESTSALKEDELPIPTADISELEAAVNCRSPPKDEIQERSAFMSAMEKPPKISDAVAEGVLQCLEELLMKCHVGSINQMVLILKNLTNAMLLSPSEAAEEFRGGVIKCFKALVLGLRLCSNGSCTCKQVNNMPIILDKRFSESFATKLPLHELNSEECLLAFFRSPSATVTVGHWLSLLLKAADVEAARGHIGSSKIRIEAFMTLRVLVAKVGTADQLAFFLPGVVSQIGKVLRSSRTMISGAAGSTEAMNQAVRGLAEFLMIVLQDEANISSLDDNTTNLNTEKYPVSILQELRHMSAKKQEGDIVSTKSIQTVIGNDSSQPGFIGNRHTESDVPTSLHVVRTKNWITTTSSHVNKLLSATFPHLCVHPSKRVRQGTIAAIQGLLSTCSLTLKGSRLMLLECVCGLVSDEDEEVSTAAHMFLRNLLSSGKHHVQLDLADIFKRLFEKLPKVVIGGEQSVVHAQKLLVLIYYSGPQLVKDRLLQSPVTAARFFDTLALSLSQNSVFSGSMDKLLLERPSSVGYLRSITEMKATTFFANEKADEPELIDHKDPNSCKTPSEYDLPRMPPWFSSSNQKLYEALAGILRLVSLSLIAGSQKDGSLSIIKDVPLSYLRKLIGDVRNKDYTKESWQSWYNRTNSGELVRQASTAACILNEMMFGLSDQAFDNLQRTFHKSGSSSENKEDNVNNIYGWNVSLNKDLRSQLIDCIGSILHEYLSPELWNLPLEESNVAVGDVTVHFFHDNAMLQQVIIDGIGIFNLCLKNDFLSSGFLHLSLYVLLENLICSNFQIRRTSDAVLHVISATSGYPTVGHLVLANSDYVIDSICRQLRHLDLNPHVPSVLAAIFSYIGVAHKILPLMEDPMRSISQELEILGRHQHPELTISFLKAVAEIAKASKLEACSLPPKAEAYYKHVQSQLSDIEKQTVDGSECSVPSFHDSSAEEHEVDAHVSSRREQWERVFFRLRESKSYRQTVGSLSSSCLTSATPLLSSVKQTACLVALEIIENGIVALGAVEESYRHETKTREVLIRALQLYSLHDLANTLEAENDETVENRLLPAMNKIWPFLIACIRNGNPLTSRRCAGVIRKVVQICGGDFFSRRFHTDGPHLWKLLTSSPFHKKPMDLKERRRLQLPYRSSSTSSEDSKAEISDLKVQVAVLDMIAKISRDKKSSSALESVFKKVSGLVVGIACSRIGGLRDSSLDALQGLASIDPDLIWLLLADIYYSKKAETYSPPPSPESDSQVFRLLPPPLSPKSYLYVEYGGQSYGFDVDFSAVEYVFKKLYLEDGSGYS